MRPCSTCMALILATTASTTSTVALVPTLPRSAPRQRHQCLSRPARPARALLRRRACTMVGGQDDILAIVHRKQAEVRQLLAQHSQPDDPLRMRLSYGKAEGQYELRNTLRRNKDPNSYHQIAVIADVKRRTPTSLPSELSAFADAGVMAEQLRDWGCDAVMINTDGYAHNGSLDDLTRAITAVGGDVPVIMKDFIVHPMQLALAVEKGASGAVLIAAVLGPALEDMMDTATIMGTEVIVEVHTPAECAKAMEYGANAIMVNQWDRVTGRLHRDQAYGMRNMMPNEVSRFVALGFIGLGLGLGLV
eukprot:TRINITY_DN3102_c1_g2_i2.p1 TRINITY_DN3102_c1_g2~~TRINITY_DN3102_c1_g2_i2.p1  ORF type:complete len:305 (+),score=58.00 TRINITY_DN3102_c1_g2_i2:108-1022(+)